MQSLPHRLFALAGHAPPEARSPVAKLFARCPRERLVRAVAWHVLEETTRSRFRPYLLVEGVRAISRGWLDLYEVDTVEPGTPPVLQTIPTRPGDAIAIRMARWGGGWSKPATGFVGTTRPETELATAWLGAAVGCLVHEDCVLVPELGALCLRARQPELF